MPNPMRQKAVEGLKVSALLTTNTSVDMGDREEFIECGAKCFIKDNI